MATPPAEANGIAEHASHTSTGRALQATSHHAEREVPTDGQDLSVPAARPDLMKHLPTLITEVTSRLHRHHQEGRQPALSVRVPAMHLLDVYSRLLSQPLIEQAKGVLMATYRIDADHAFQVLKRFSQAENVKLRDLAQTLVNGQHQTGLSPSELLQHHAPQPEH